MDGKVAIGVPDDPETARVILARGRRIARHLGLEWIALRVESRHRSGRIRALVELVATLGGQLVWEESEDVARGLVELSRREGSRVLVIGPSRRPRILRRLRCGTTERILRSERAFDVIVAAQGVEG